MFCHYFITMKKLLLTTILLISVSIGRAQTKYEKELRIKPDQVPKNAIEFVQLLNFGTKIKWYQELSETGSSIEAKTKYKGEHYSIEFSKDGTLEDVEVKIRWNTIPEIVRKRITNDLELKYDDYKLNKVQIQYQGNPNAIRSYLIKGTDFNEITINYEVVISTKVNKKFTQFELLYSAEGILLKRAEIVLRNSDNIEY